ncbi:YecA family protein [Roseivirga sp. BDSF3-8]|uniref:YecA family protein n=1 Tax=Roseivirga sp. BDSF3-8 TaxID=3241598 RepID=UPI003531AD50
MTSNTDIKKTEDVIKEIEDVIYSKGYIYSLCMIIVESFRLRLEEIHEVNFIERLNKNEVALIIGLLIKRDIDFSYPNDHREVLKLKKRTYALMNDLHQSLMYPFFEKLKVDLEVPRNVDLLGLQAERKLFYENENMFIEPIFYANDGVYDFQYIDFLDKKYKYDKKWLLENRSFSFEETKLILHNIKEVLYRKGDIVDYYSLKEKYQEIRKELKKTFKGNMVMLNEALSNLEFFQYIKLFGKDGGQQNNNSTSFSELEWDKFYKNLLHLFVVKKQDFASELDIDSFLKNFSIKINQKGLNKGFKTIGDFNRFTAQPILQISEDSFFIPIPFLLYEACYESPFYWMGEDASYLNDLAKNRGNSSEEICYDFLKSVFGEKNTFKSVRVSSKKGVDATDIDVLCILGNKALCVQIKSKKLALLSRKGSIDQLRKDFQGAVQDAYDQGVISRNSVLSNKPKFFDEYGGQITFADEIDDVYIMGVTSENYPALTHQAHTLLHKDENDPYPLFLTVFDLEILVYYLNNPYKFMYYVRQRIDLMDYFKADSELVYLGYHLIHKLWKFPDQDHVSLDANFGGVIDRNYYPYKLGVQTSEESDPYQNRWINKDFEELIDLIGAFDDPKKTDIIFALMDFNGDSVDSLIKYMKATKRKTIIDHENHNMTMPMSETSFGITYFSHKKDNLDELKRILADFTQAKKYKSKSRKWLGLGSLKSSSKLFDVLLYYDDEWGFNTNLEDMIQFLPTNEALVRKPDGERIGRNDLCFCGSGKKYKKCCG